MRQIVVKRPIKASSAVGVRESAQVKMLMKQLFNAMDDLYSVNSDLFDEMDLASLYNDLDVTIRENS